MEDDLYVCLCVCVCVCVQKTERYSSYPVYHSVYETFEIVESFYDPSFRRLRAVAQVRGGLVFSLADSQLLPLSADQYADSLGKYARIIALLAHRHPEEMEMFKVSFGELKFVHVRSDTSEIRIFKEVNHLVDLTSQNFKINVPPHLQRLCFLQWKTSLLQPGVSMSVCRASTEQSELNMVFDLKCPKERGNVLTCMF